MADLTHCSFCGKRADEVGSLVRNNPSTACICDECVILCATILLTENSKGVFASDLADLIENYRRGE